MHLSQWRLRWTFSQARRANASCNRAAQAALALLLVGATARTPARLGNGRLTYSRLGDDLRGARLRGHELLNTTTTLHDFQLVRGEDRVIMWRLSPQSSKRCGSSRSSPSLPLSQRVSTARSVGFASRKSPQSMNPRGIK